MQKLINAVAMRLHFVGGIAVVAMTIIMTLDVVARYALKTGIADTIEISSMFLGAVTALALASVTMQEEHIRFSVLTDMFPRLGQGFSKVLTRLIALGMFGLMTWHATIRGIDTLKSGEFMGALQIPIWPFRLMFAFGCLLTFLVVLFQLISRFTRNADGGSENVKKLIHKESS